MSAHAGISEGHTVVFQHSPLHPVVLHTLQHINKKRSAEPGTTGSFTLSPCRVTRLPLRCWVGGIELDMHARCCCCLPARPLLSSMSCACAFPLDAYLEIVSASNQHHRRTGEDEDASSTYLLARLSLDPLINKQSNLVTYSQVEEIYGCSRS